MEEIAGNLMSGKYALSLETAVMERTFIAIKPDGVQRKLVSEIIGRFEKKGRSEERRVGKEC